MSRREIVIRKLYSLPKEQVDEAMWQLTSHVEMKLHFKKSGDRTKKGAHSENNLGMPAVEYYCGEAVRRLFDPNKGWNWKFEIRSLGEQLCRIADKLMPDVVAKWKNESQVRESFDQRDVADIKNLTAEDTDEGKEEEYKRLVDLAYSVSEDDSDLTDFCLRFFDQKDYDTIATEMGIAIKDVY